jgi:hypothetical protein
VLPAAQVVGPLYPMPPHWPHFITVPMGVLDDPGALLVGLEGLEGLEPVPPVKVLLMGPHLMLEKVTEAPGDWLSTVFGSPDDAEHDPLETPGAVAALVGG